VRARFAAVLLLAITRDAAAAAGPDKRAILGARDEAFQRSEFTLHDDRGESFLLEVMTTVGKAVQRFKNEHPAVFTAITVLLVATLLILVAHIVWKLAMARRARYAKEPALPELDVRRTPPANFRERAVELAAESRYEDAARELYTALVLTLDARGDLTYARHKALLDYRMESRRRDARDALDLFARGYHPASFGRRTLAADRFEALLSALDGVTT